MTRSPKQCEGGAGSILSRLLLVLAFVFFGAPQGHADGGANTGPAAQNKVEQADAILTAQRHLLRAQLPGDSAPDMAMPEALVQAQPPLVAVAVLPAPHPSVVTDAVRILPPVRAPPAV